VNPATWPSSACGAHPISPNLKITRRSFCELMSGLARGKWPAPPEAERALLAAHLVAWIGHFLADLERTERAQFYRSVGALGRVKSKPRPSRCPLSDPGLLRSSLNSNLPNASLTERVHCSLGRTGLFEFQAILFSDWKRNIDLTKGATCLGRVPHGTHTAPTGLRSGLSAPHSPGS
jgi:hypothetical protein